VRPLENLASLRGQPSNRGPTRRATRAHAARSKRESAGAWAGRSGPVRDGGYVARWDWTGRVGSFDLAAEDVRRSRPPWSRHMVRYCVQQIHHHPQRRPAGSKMVSAVVNFFLTCLFLLWFIFTCQNGQELDRQSFKIVHSNHNIL
jgi:hypothetical protein